MQKVDTCKLYLKLININANGEAATYSISDSISSLLKRYFSPFLHSTSSLSVIKLYLGFEGWSSKIKISLHVSHMTQLINIF